MGPQEPLDAEKTTSATRRTVFLILSNRTAYRLRPVIVLPRAPRGAPLEEAPNMTTSRTLLRARARFPHHFCILALVLAHAIVPSLTSSAAASGAAATTGEAPAVAAYVRHAPHITGKVEGSVQQLLPETVSINGSAIVTGDLLVPGRPAVRVNGSPAFGGTVDGTGAATPTNYRVTVSGNAQLAHVVRRTDAIAMPEVAAPPSPTGTRSVHITQPGEPVGDWSTLRDLTLSGQADNVDVPAGTYGTFRANGGTSFTLGDPLSAGPLVYNFQELVLGGQSALIVAGPVIVNLASGLTLNASAGSTDDPCLLELNVASGGVTLHGGSTLSAIVRAPNGMVTVNGNCVLYGEVYCDQLRVVGTGLLASATCSVPGPTEVVPYQSEWKYYIFPYDGTPSDWGAVDFDDSYFLIGAGAFGSGGYCEIQETVQTLWPNTTEIVVRRDFNLPAGVHTLRIAGSVDNDVQIYLNGNPITSDWVAHENCPQPDDLSFTAPPATYHQGVNSIAIRARDRHGLSFLDYRILINEE